MYFEEMPSLSSRQNRRTVRSGTRFRLGFGFLVLVAGLLSGCQTVQPWERGTLTDYTMRSDRDGLATALKSHVYYTREAASGGEGVGGGGCGCN